MNGNKAFKVLVCIALVLAVVGLFTPRGAEDPLSPFAYQTDVYLTDGGDKLVVASGGEIEIQSGATADYQEGATYTLPAADKVLVDGATTANTGTAGILDINHATITADASAVNIAATVNTGATSAADNFGMVMALTQDDADADLFGISITAAATTNAAAGSYEAGIVYDCAENTAGACLDGVRLTAGTSLGMTDAIDASASNIVNALNAGDNDIAVTNNLNVKNASTGNVTLNLRDYADTTDDDMAHVDLVGNCTNTGSGTEECDLAINTVRAGTASTAINVDADAEMTLLSETEFELQNAASGNVMLIFQDYADTATDDLDHVVLTANCTDATATEDCDFTIGVVENAAAVETRFFIDADGNVEIGGATNDAVVFLPDVDVQVQNQTSGNVSLDLRDYADTTDDDMAHASFIANCTGTGTGAEECDLAIATVRAGAESTAINVDADGEMTLLSETEFEFVNAATGNVDLILQDFADSADDDMNHVILSGNCTTATTGAEDCDLAIKVAEGGSAPATRLLIDADDNVQLKHNTSIEHDASGDVDLTFRDYADTTDDDQEHGIVRVNCSSTGTGAEECDMSLLTVTAGGTPGVQMFLDGSAGEVQLRNTATGNVDLSFRDYTDTTDDDQAHAIVRGNCSGTGTGAEECELSLLTVTAGAAPATQVFLDGSGGEMQLWNTVTGNVDLSLRDYADSADDDMAHTLLRTNCTDATSGAEDCDFSISVPEAGGAVNERFLIDADDGVDIGSTTNANVTLISGVDTLVHDGDLTLDTDATGGNALAKNEFIGLPRIKFVALSTMANGTTNTVITDMGDSQTPATDWTADPDADVVMSNDATYYREGSASLKMAVSTAADDDDGCINLLGSGDQDWTDDEAVGFWFYADTTLAGNELDFNIHDSGPVDSAVLLPAYGTADVWVWVELDISGVANASKNIIENVSIRLTAAGAAKAVGGAFNVYFDFIVKWDAGEEESTGVAIPYDGVLSLMMLDATSGAATNSILTEYSDYFVHYQSGADAIVIISDQSDADKLGLALIAY